MKKALSQRTLLSVSSSELTLGRNIATLIKKQSKAAGGRDTENTTLLPLLSGEVDPSLPQSDDVAQLYNRLWADLQLPADLSSLPEATLRALLPELDVHEAHEIARLNKPNGVA